VVSRFKIYSDPVHGFISAPKPFITDLIQTPEFQRLRRICQIGVGRLVFPGAEHTRFGHALGAMALMNDVLTSVEDKGTPISRDEYTAALAAALLHDIGHGPYSHTLEHDLISNFNHEDMSRVLLLHLNERFDGALDLAIQMFDGTYERSFFHQLVSSQLDMDRLDYLRRDSFYTGVVEGAVGVERIIKTMRIHPNEGGHGSKVVIESKGVYAVENFIISRRLMYWQVYLHKTVLAGDQLLRSILSRVRQMIREGRKCVKAGTSSSLLFFLEHDIDVKDIGRKDVLTHFCNLDDTDILMSLKQWMSCDDPVLVDLCRRFIHRDLFRVSFLSNLPKQPKIRLWHNQIASWLVSQALSTQAHATLDAHFYISHDDSQHAAYEAEKDSILIIDKAGNISELSETADALTITSQSQFETKPYVCYPKEVELEL